LGTITRGLGLIATSLWLNIKSARACIAKKDFRRAGRCLETIGHIRDHAKHPTLQRAARAAYSAINHEMRLAEFHHSVGISSRVTAATLAAPSIGARASATIVHLGA
jgi:hypothetical protein